MLPGYRRLRETGSSFRQWRSAPRSEAPAESASPAPLTPASAAIFWQCAVRCRSRIGPRKAVRLLTEQCLLYIRLRQLFQLREDSVHLEVLGARLVAGFRWRIEKLLREVLANILDGRIVENQRGG